MNRFLVFLFISFMFLAGYSQVPAGRSNNTTLFDAFSPATILLKNGEINRQMQANIFLKDASFVYKKTGTVMRASMNVIESVTFGTRRFININNQLGEVVDTCNGNCLVRMKLIDKDAMEGEYRNNSIITGLTFGTDNISSTQIDADPSLMKYPLVAKYYLVTKKKTFICHEREVKLNVPKSKMKDYERFLGALSFNWSDESHLSELLKFFSK